MHALRLVFVLACIIAAAAPARATQITVDSDAPGFDANACTLYNAMWSVAHLETAGTCPAGTGVDQIDLPANATITVGEQAPGSDDAAFTNVSSNLLIRGHGATITTSFDGCDPHSGPYLRFFSVQSGARLELRDLALSNGCIDFSHGEGGGAIIAYESTLVLVRVALTHNTSEGWSGGAIYALDSTLFINGSTVSDNVSDSAVFPAAVFAQGGVVSVAASTFARNAGGALMAGTVEVINSTFHGNTRGSAIDIGIAGSISFSTFIGNEPQSLLPEGTSTLALANNVIVQAPGGGYQPVCDLQPMQGETADVTLAGANFADDASCGNVTVVPRPALALAALGSYDGPVPTAPLHAGSAAIDAAACTDAHGNPVATDARGAPRPSGSGCDAGAFEYTNEDLGTLPSVGLPVGGVLVSNLGYATAFDRNGNEVQRVYASHVPDLYQSLCGVDAIGASGFGAQLGTLMAGDSVLARYSAASDDWTFASAPNRSTRYCGTAAHVGTRWFLTVGGLSYMQDHYGVSVFDDGVVRDPIATDLVVVDVVLGKDGRLYLLGEPLDGSPGYVVRAYDPVTLLPFGDMPLAGNPGNVDTVSIAVAANGDLYVGRRGAEIDHYDASGALLQTTDCVVPGNGHQCNVVTNLRLSDDGLLFVGDHAGRVTILQPDFSAASSFDVGYAGTDCYVAPLALDLIFADSFDR
jgi:predicted outer membrane repeat protein